jgi:hypothetical protein
MKHLSGREVDHGRAATVLLSHLSLPGAVAQDAM